MNNPMTIVDHLGQHRDYPIASILSKRWNAIIEDHFISKEDMDKEWPIPPDMEASHRIKKKKKYDEVTKSVCMYIQYIRVYNMLKFGKR